MKKYKSRYLDELSKKTLKSYIWHASYDKSNQADEIGQQNALGVALGRPRDAEFKKAQRKHGNRSAGISLAADKLSRTGLKKAPKGSFDTAWKDKPLAKRRALLDKKKITYRQRNEEVLDEVSKNKLSNYLERAQRDYNMAHTAYRNTTKDNEKQYYSRKVKNLKKGISRAISKLDKQNIKEDIMSKLDENNFEQPGTKNIDTKPLKLQKQKHTAAMKSHETHKLDNDEDHSVLSNILKGKYPHGTVNPSTAKAVVGALRSLDPKVRRHVIMKIYYEPKAFDNFFNEGFVEFDENELEQLDELSKKTLASYIKQASDAKSGAMAGILAGDSESKRHYLNRRKGIIRAADKLAKK